MTPRLTGLMIAVGVLAKLHLKRAAGKGSPKAIEEAFIAALDALNQLRLKGDPTIRVTDATVKESM